MSAVMKLIDVRLIAEADDWHNSVDRRNYKARSKFLTVDYDADTVVTKHYIDNEDAAIKMALLTTMRDILKQQCNKIHPTGNTYCHIYTYAIWRTQQKFGADAAGRITGDGYDIRGVSRKPEIRDYFQQVVREVVEQAKALA